MTDGISNIKPGTGACLSAGAVSARLPRAWLTVGADQPLRARGALCWRRALATLTPASAPRTPRERADPLLPAWWGGAARRAGARYRSCPATGLVDGLAGLGEGGALEL